MAMIRTDFRPEIDGYAFPNTWSVDEGERGKVRDIVRQAVPAAVGILSPVLAAASPLVLAAIGPAIALAGPFIPLLPFFAPLIAEKIVDSISDAVADTANARCAGMAFSSVDYFMLNWVLPRGNSASDQPLHTQGGSDPGDWLRNYIWDRLLDSHRANGATFVSWIAMNKMLGDYGREWVRDRVREEIDKIRSKIATGTPWPIGLLGDSGNPTESHVVVATGFEDVGLHRCRIEVYDNNREDVTCILDVDAGGQFVSISETVANRSWGGVFCAEYTPSRPRPMLVVTSLLSLSPSNFAGAGRPVRAMFTAMNNGFHSSLPLHLCVGGRKWAYGEENASVRNTVTEGSAIPLAAPIEFALNQATTYELFPKVCVWPVNDGAPSYKLLPYSDGADVEAVVYRITPVIKIHASAAGGGANGCVTPFREGGSVFLTPDIGVLAGVGIAALTWTVTGAIMLTSHAHTLMLSNLPASPAAVHVNLVVSLNDGTDAYGSTGFVTIDAAFASRLEQLCELGHIVKRLPIVRMPLGPAVDPVPDWFNNPAVRKAVDPQAFVRAYAAGVREMERMLERWHR